MAASPVQFPDDPAFHQLAQLWPELHPHAQRALALYAAMLCAEGPAGEE